MSSVHVHVLCVAEHAYLKRAISPLTHFRNITHVGDCLRHNHRLAKNELVGLMILLGEYNSTLITTIVM